MKNQFNERKSASNSCINCEYEMTCGYSHLATLGHRTEFSYKECCLGEMAYNRGSFFKAKQ